MFYHYEEDVVDEEAGSATCFDGNGNCRVAMLRVLVDLSGHLTAKRAWLVCEM